MIKLNSTQLWVHDQDAALAFYTQKLGFEVRSDITVAEMGDFRWLEVAASGQDVTVVLMAVPGPPVMDDDTTTRVNELMGKGFAGTLFLGTEDCQADYEALTARGVEFIDRPTEQMYGLDASFRDPSGNHIRLTQLREMAPTG